MNFRVRDQYRAGCAVVIWACLGLLSSVSAQYRFDHWTADNGLPQNSVREIIQTRDGYLWLTTFDGLVRFDGVRFTVFNKSNSSGLVSNRFHNLYEDGQGSLWVTTDNNGLLQFHQGRFTSYTTQNGLPQNRIFSIGDDGDGGLVMFPGLQCFRWVNGQFALTPELRLPLQPQSLAARQPLQRTAFYSDNQTELKAVSNGRLYTFKLADFPPGFQATSSATDREGVLWFGSTAHGLFGFEQGRLTKRLTIADGLPANHAQLIYGPQPLQVYCVSEDGSLWLFDMTTRQRELLTRTPPDKPSLCYADREGNYWFVTYNDGLYRYQRQSITMLNQAQGLKTDEIYPLLEDRQGTIWIGTALDGLYRWQQGELQHYDPARQGIPKSISSLYEDRAGRIWVNGAFRLEGDRFVRVYDELADLVWTMYEAPDGAFWRGTSQGVDRFHKGIKTHFTTADGLANNRTTVILEAGDGGLWLGSYGGLTHYKDGKFTKWTERDGLPATSIRMLRQDPDGVLWIGTYDSGLIRFKNGQFTQYNVKTGLFDNGVFQMLEDEQGWCWMSCNRGIFRVRKQELNDFAEGKIKRLNSVPYGKSDGMSNVECNGGRWPAGVKTRDGKLWFPTMDGIAIVDPARVVRNEQPPPIKIEGMRIDYQTVAPEMWYNALHQPSGAIEIQPGQENFELDYTALSFINSEQLKFRYKLSGLDQDWVEAGTRRLANFSHVPPGSYTFTVIAANRDGVWNTEGQSIKIIVQPRFYRTWWFLTLVVLAMGGVIFALYDYRVRQLRRIQVAQEAFSRQLIASQESERKRIASELHDSLGQSLVLIRNWAMLGASQLEPQSPAQEELEEIKTMASQAINEVREIAYNLGPYHLDRLGLAETIREMINRVAQSSGIHFTTNLDPLDESLSREAEMGLYRITQESLNNLVKHAAATQASVTIERLPSGVKLTVTDNGKGFDPQAVLASTQKAGFGLPGLFERVRLLNGTLTIHSAPGQGTTLEVTLHNKDSSHE